MLDTFSEDSDVIRNLLKIKRRMEAELLYYLLKTQGLQRHRRG